MFLSATAPRLDKLKDQEITLAEAIIEARAVEKYYPQPDGNRIEVIAPTDLSVSPGKLLPCLDLRARANPRCCAC